MKIFNKLLLVAAVVAATNGVLSAIPLSGPAFAQGGAADSSGGGNRAIHEMIYQAVAGQEVPGYAIAIIKDGNVAFRATYGQADVEQNKKVSKDTIFGLASLTKTFTAMALLHLVDEKKINPNDSLDKYLKNIPSSWQKLTIFQLASMRAGLPESRGDELPWPEEMPYLEKQPLVYEPNSKTLYSNPSFRILGTVIESVTGMPYLDYIGQVILKPLGMNSTGTTLTMAESGRVSCQYVPGQGGEVTRIKPKNPITAFSAGMLASSLDDMCLYAEALLDKKILSKAAYQLYFYDRPPVASGEPANWAYGWNSVINPKLNQRVISMNGGLPGVASIVMLVPDSNAAVVALSNLRKKPVYAIAKRALNMFLTGSDLDQPGPGTAGGSGGPDAGGQ